MKNQKWFWMTLGTWCFIAAGAWALIFSPFHLRSREISEFSVKVNGADEKNQIWACEVSVPKSLESLSHEWESEGWKCSTGKFNLASALLLLPPEDQEILAQVIQLRVFEKKHFYRLLGAINNPEENQTYGWTAEFPQAALQSQNPSKIDFPLKPPAGAFEILDLEFQKMAACSWSLPAVKNPRIQLQRIYTAQGFSGRLFAQQDGESVYILQRGPIKLMAVLEVADKKSTISVVKLDKI